MDGCRWLGVKLDPGKCASYLAIQLVKRKYVGLRVVSWNDGHNVHSALCRCKYNLLQRHADYVGRSSCDLSIQTDTSLSGSTDTKVSTDTKTCLNDLPGNAKLEAILSIERLYSIQNTSSCIIMFNTVLPTHHNLQVMID